MTTDLLDKMLLELRRGVLVLAVLRALQKEHYGYSLRKHLNNRGLEIDEGTLYPLIRRLESYGLLQSEWREDEGRRRRYYRISAEGRQLLKKLVLEWRDLNDAVNNLENK